MSFEDDMVRSVQDGRAGRESGARAERDREAARRRGASQVEQVFLEARRALERCGIAPDPVVAPQVGTERPLFGRPTQVFECRPVGHGWILKGSAAPPGSLSLNATAILSADGEPRLYQITGRAVVAPTDFRRRMTDTEDSPRRNRGLCPVRTLRFCAQRAGGDFGTPPLSPSILGFVHGMTGHDRDAKRHTAVWRNKECGTTAGRPFLLAPSGQFRLTGTDDGEPGILLSGSTFDEGDISAVCPLRAFLNSGASRLASG